jgi:DNA-binding CsgD family transcriptional regulator/N-acetylneuraminic acid mutarotase
MAEELTPLSDRELEIVRLLATGATNQQIARELVISVNTVKVHLRNIYGKLGVASRTEATMVAVRQGWVTVARDQAEEQTGPPSAETAAAASGPAAISLVERWPPVSLAKRIALLAAGLIALALLVLPQILEGDTNGGEPDPIGGVFPTVSAGSPTDRWRTRAQMPTPRSGLAVVAYDGLVYAIGGVSNEGATAKVEVYDPQADAWSTRKPKPTAVGFVSAVVVGDRVYVPGGIGANKRHRDILEVYDPVQDVWESRASLPEPLAAYGLATLDGKIYLFGGQGPQGYVSSAYRYDPETDLWQTLKPMDQARGLLGAAAQGERIYVIGGSGGETEFDTCEAYEPASDTWTPCAPMELRRGGLAVVAVREKLYTIGGGMTSYLAFNESYHPRTDAWNRIETPVTEEWRGLGTAFISPNIYAIGGWSGGNLSVNEAYQALFQIQVPAVNP